ncbi:MAG: elongation factor G [Alphaproteobacteria bacterium]|nr:elongation factor G [Alphaproteobacteria bacterium]
MTKAASSPRCVALVGPYLSGKTTLMESMLMAAGALHRKGSVRQGNSVGDASPEARQRQMSTELNVGHCDYLGDSWSILDCPGSVELLQESLNALMVADAVVVVCEGDPSKALTVGPVLRMLDDHDVPHMLFINKMDLLGGQVKETLEALQEHSKHPLVLREIPIREGDQVVGHVDLVSERAFKWRDHAESELMEMPAALAAREHGARDELLETLADYDDTLMEELLEDVAPDTSEIYENLARDLVHDDIVPVFFGSAEHDNGIRRLWKALRHECPEVSLTAQRLGVKDAAAQVFKTLHAGHQGKLSIARVWQGEVKDGQTFDQGRVSGLFKVQGQSFEKSKTAQAGDVVALARLENVGTGDALGGTGTEWPEPLKGLYSMSVQMQGHADDVKLSQALQKLCDEDPSLVVEHQDSTGELVLWGQGEMHLRIAMDKLTGRHGLSVQSKRPQVPYKETIAKGAKHRARHKKQSGGHGEFGDVEIVIAPLNRGEGFQFEEKIHGGTVPRQYIPSVEAGVKEYLGRGPLGFPVVDIQVTLTDGQYHNVDSSDFAFKKAAQLAMREAMPGCQPVLLEPINEVKVSIPNAYTSNAQRVISSRRGQILGFNPRDGWQGWDEVTAYLPASEMHDLIIDLRSQTLGVGTFDFRFDHLQELVGKNAEQVVAERNG